MTDIVDAVTRSRMMAGIRAVNTKPELLVRKALHTEGLRFRIHDSSIPGRPDLVLRKHHVAVFVHGCFWHGHDCRYFKMPKSRQAFWEAKIGRNRKRDVVVREELGKAGWRVAVVWECAIKGKSPRAISAVGKKLASAIRGARRCIEIQD